MENNKPVVVDSTQANQRTFGHAAVLSDGVLTGYHVTDDPQKIMDVINGPKKLTATFKNGKYVELGPGLYVSALADFWLNRSRSKWDFLKTMTPQQKQVVGQAILDKIKPKEIEGRPFRYVSQYEEESAKRLVDQWVNSDFNDAIVMLAGQPYNVPFWKPEFLRPLGVEPSAPPKVITIKFSGKFVNLKDHVGDWITIAECIRTGHDGGFNPGGYVGNPELCIWRKECILSVTMN